MDLRLYRIITASNTPDEKALTPLETRDCIMIFRKNNQFNKMRMCNQMVMNIAQMLKRQLTHQWDHRCQKFIQRKSLNTKDSHQIVKSAEAAPATVAAVKEDIVKLKK